MEILDDSKEKIQIRKTYFSLLEFYIIGVNVIFMLLTIALIFMNVFESKLSLLVLVLIVVFIFIAAPIQYIWNWRKDSIQYQNTGNLNFLQRGRKSIDIFLFSGILWTFILIIGGGIFWDAPEEISTIAFWAGSIFAITLGPVQMLYLYYIVRLKKRLSEI